MVPPHVYSQSHPVILIAGGIGAKTTQLFTAEALAPVVFHPNFTFAQGHTAFHANSEDPKQFGMLVGRPGALEAGTTLLGYVVLPPSIDLAQPIVQSTTVQEAMQKGFDRKIAGADAQDAIEDYPTQRPESSWVSART